MSATKNETAARDFTDEGYGDQLGRKSVLRFFLLAALHEQLPDDSELFFILGQDSVADLPNWRQPQRIISLARLAVAARTAWEPAEASALEKEVPGISQRLVWLDMPRIDISSTAVRDRVRRGLSIRCWVPPSVEEYIRQHGLYVGG